MGVETVREALVSLWIRPTVEAGMETWVLVTSPVISGLITMVRLWFSTASRTSLSPSAALTAVIAVPSRTSVCAGVLFAAAGGVVVVPPPVAVAAWTVTSIWNSTVL